MSSFYKLVDYIGLWSCYRFSSLITRAPLYLRSSWCYIHRIFFFLYLLVSWAWCDWPLTWLTNHCPSVLWHCWLGHTTRKIVSETTCSVSTRYTIVGLTPSEFRKDVWKTIEWLAIMLINMPWLSRDILSRFNTIPERDICKETARRTGNIAHTARSSAILQRPRVLHVTMSLNILLSH